MRTKKTFLNLLTDVIPLILVSFLGIFKLKLFIQVLGDETLGLYQLFTQIMIYIAIVDGGISNALLYSLYKPNTKNDQKGLNKLLSAGAKCFSLIGTVVFFLAFLVSFFIPFFIKDNQFPHLYVSMTFLLFSLSNVSSYFFVPYQTLLEVKEKKYLSNLSLQIGQITQSILEIIMLILGVPFTIILLMHSLVKLVANFVIMIIAKKLHPEINYYEKEKDYSFTKQLKDLIFHKINGLVGSNIDVLIITNVIGLKGVAIYSTYHYIINMLKEIFNKFSSSMIAIIGNKIESEKQDIYQLFKEIKSLMFYLATIICTPLLFAINPFINIWYEGSIQTNFIIALSFVLTLFIHIVVISITVFINAKGLFKETKICAITDTIVNLILSLILCYFIKIPGVLIATFIAIFIAEYCMKTNIIYKEIFKKPTYLFHVENIKYFIVLILDVLGSYFIIQNIAINNILMWFLVFLIFTILNAFIILGIYKIMNEVKFLKRIKELKKGSK